jgi:transcriptional regulator with XRE-family HTH domain
MAGWKKATLAGVAGISLSTVERVERGQAVSAETLDRLAAALRQAPGAFTTPRFKLSEREAGALIVERLGWIAKTSPVSVSPLRNQAQLRRLSDTVVSLLDHDLEAAANEDVVNLREWFGLVGFVRAEQKGLIGRERPRRHNLRRLYGDVLDCVRDVERHHRCVCLVGVYHPELVERPGGRLAVGVVALKSKTADPAAPSRRTLYAPSTLDLGAALAQAFDDGTRP